VRGDVGNTRDTGRIGENLPRLIPKRQGCDPMSGDRNPNLRAHVVVRGRVQNVFFRASCRKEAARLGVTGFVSNLRDGRVEAVFEGEVNAVRAAVDWCRRGPPGATVDSIEVNFEEPVGETGFRVR
jgi:acylphosphatase